ncbi:MAG: hybrid sensor histidine kinase/response regulator [Herminiimonas sp.]|nr:hybrid sensor histidine kinase/response regulator [Herminiimonas sp.]MDB5852977.1 hybrid sensor histidine kinase/response regulator [Herminiimonas sp.]
MHGPNEKQVKLDNAETILDSITDAFFSLNENWEFSYVNRQTESTLGRQASELLGKSLWDVYPGTVGSEFEMMYRKAAQERIAVTFSSYYPDHDRWYEVNVYPAHGGLSVYFRNVTDREQQAMRRSASIMLTDTLGSLTTPDEITFKASQILGETLAASRVGYGTINPVAETLTVTRDWNAPGAETLAGVLNLRDFGSFIDDLKAGKLVWINDVEKDHRTKGAASALKQRSAGSFVNVPIVEQGRLVAVVFVNSAQARNWSNEELAFIKDVAERARTASERLRNEVALKESEAKFRTIANAMPQMVWSALPDGHHDYYNQRWYDFTGLDQTTTAADDWKNIFHPDDRARAWELWQQCLITGEQYEIQYRLRHNSGEYRWTLGRSLPIRDDTGKIIRWMGTCTDIHDQKLAEERLKEADARKDEFLAMLAHELRNPLAPIGAAAQLLQMGALDEARVRQTSQIIGRQVHHMTSLVDDLLDVSRVTRGLVKLDRAQIDIGHVVADAIEQVTPLIRARHQHLGLQLTPEAPLVIGDKKRLVQVIVNLLNNAAKYTREGGQLLLKTEVRDAHVLIQVTDNGIGMAPELVSRAFDLFVQAERTSDRSSGGLGLGLALVKSLVDLHRGTVSCESAGLGKGSTFTVCLPRLLALDRGTDSAAPDPSSHKSTAPLRILVVDDNVDAASMLSMLLESSGHEVVVEYGPHAALERAKVEAPQVCILDIGLPEMDGNELAQRLRAMPQTAHSVLIAVTGYGQDSDRGQTLAAGFDHHLVKPVDTKKLLAILASYWSGPDV